MLTKLLRLYLINKHYQFLRQNYGVSALDYIDDLYAYIVKGEK